MKWLVLPFLLLIIFLLYQSVDNSCDTTDNVDAFLHVVKGERTLLGFNLGNDALTFGTISPGSSSARTMDATYSKSAHVDVTVEGNLAEWMVIEPNSFSVSQEKNVTVEFIVDVPQNGTAGNYYGLVTFCFKE